MYSTVQYSTVQYSTVQYSTVQYSTALYHALSYIKADIHHASLEAIVQTTYIHTIHTCILGVFIL